MKFPSTSATLDSLANGLTLILDPDPAAPVVSTQLWVETGSIHEAPHLGAGLSHFLEHMVFKGGGEFGASELSEAVQAAGGHWNAYTTFERTVYFIDGPESGLDTFLQVLAAMVFRPHLPESEFEREKDVIRREIDMGFDDPDDTAMRLLFSTAFAHDARRHPVIGYRDRFDALTHDDLTGYHRRRYTPARACLCVSGDFDADALRAEIEAHFGDLTGPGGDEPLIPVEPEQLAPRFGHGRFAIPASKITLAWPCPPLGHPDGPALDLLAAMLGSGRSARLYRRLRETRGLALEITAMSWSMPSLTGLFAVSAETPPEQREELIAAIRDELRGFADSDFEAELAKAKRQLSAAQFGTLTTASGRASDLASNWHEARDLDFTRRYLERINRVTPGDIVRALGHLLDDRETLTVLDPEDAAAPAVTRPARRTPAATRTLTLDNGLIVGLLPDPRVPVFSLSAAVRAGASSETPATAGINRLLAASLPHASTTRDAVETADMLESLGASMSASAGNNSTLVRLSGLAEDLPTLLPLFAEILAAPLLDAASIERERASQRAALAESLDDPLSLAFRELRAGMFGTAGFGIPSLGHPESLETLARPQLVEHHARHFQARNLTVALAGDFDPAEAGERLRESLAALPAGAAWTPPQSSWREAGEIGAALPKRQAALAIGFPGVGADHPDRHALGFLQEWAADMAGPLFTRIREQHGLAYQVGATQFHGHDTGLFVFYLATDPAQLEFAETELREEIAKLAADGVPADAFERVRATILSRTALQAQPPGAISRQAAVDMLFGLPADHFREMPGIFRALTPDDVRRAARSLLEGRPGVTVRIKPDETVNNS
jgi:zinc protease